MVLGGLATLVGSIWTTGGQLLAWLAWPFTAYTIRVVSWLAGLPLANVSLGRLGPAWLVVFYGLLFGITAAGHLPDLPRPRRAALPRAAVLLLLSLGVFVTWNEVSRRPDGRLHLTVFDTHGGQAALLTAPSGRTVLINGGRSPISLEDNLASQLPPFRRNIDWLVISSAQEQDLLGLADLTDRFEVSGVLAADSLGSGPAWALARDLHEHGVPFASPQAGSELDLGDGARLSVISATDGEAVLVVAMGRARFLLLSGPQTESFAQAGRDPSLEQTQVIVLRDAGGITPEAADWLRNLGPSTLVLSADPADPASLPPLPLQAAFGTVRTLRTDQLGTIQLTTDGLSLWAVSQRRPGHLPGF
jgi:beta-lactamase superfamily II metal-dependent hydrolase